MYAQVERDERVEQIIGYLGLTRECFNAESVITANLNELRVLFAGALLETSEDERGEGVGQKEVIPLVQTTGRGNTWTVAGPWDWVRIVPRTLMGYFTDGTSPVVMGCLIKGRFKSNFPDGIEVSLTALR
jgi:hypothetical protein